MKTDQIQKIKLESIADFGSEMIQKRYEKIAEEGLWESEKILIKKYFKPKTKILDIGCGSGRSAIPLAQMSFDVLGVDITPQMIDMAKQKAAEQKLEIEYQVGDVADLKLSDNSFDGAIFANNGWVQIPGKENRQKALDEIYRVLKSDGIFILTAHRRYYTLNNSFFWLGQFIKHFVLKPFGIKIAELEFGDTFYRKYYSNGKLERQNFIRMTGAGEVEKQIQRSGFKLIESEPMGKIAEADGKSMKGSMSENFDSFKSPVFFICKK